MNTESAYRHGTAPTAPPRRVAVDELRRHVTAVLSATGLTRSAATLVADSLTDAEASGISSHGVTRTRIYAERLTAGLIDPGAEPTVSKESGAAIRVDARNAIGHVGADAGLTAAIEHAERSGVGIAGVANSNHCGTLSFFTRRAARAGLACIAFSTAPPTMVYFGGRSRAVGTNPISIALPGPDEIPVVVDMATSATARGKIILAHQLGDEIPHGWAVDADGRPTTDAARALRGSVTPFSGPKGSGLAMMIDLLAGAMVGGVSGGGIGDMYEDWSRTQRVGHLFIVMNPDAWIGRKAFADHIDEFTREVHGLPPAEGFDTVLLPGEVEERARRRAEATGIELSATVFTDLTDIATEVGQPRTLRTLPGH